MLWPEVIVAKTETLQSHFSISNVAYTNFHKVREIQFLQFSAVMVLVWRRKGPKNDSVPVFSFKSGEPGKLVPQII